MKTHFVIHCAGCDTYRKQPARSGPCVCGGTFVRRKSKPYKGRKVKKRATDEECAAMRAAYEAGNSMVEVGRLFPRKNGKPRHAGDVRDYLLRAGAVIRLSATALRPRGPHGEMIAAPRLTDAQVRRVIAAMPAAARRGHPFRIPEVMKNEWRGYSQERRAWVLSLLRERFPSTMPCGPFSANVTPFDYASPAAWALADEANAGLPSRNWKIRLFPVSEGVIFGGALWFWIPKTGYMRGVWTPQDGRPSLHHHLWERRHGTVPAGHVVRFADGNANNFEPENLVLASRNELARENQAAFQTKQSRELTALLLKRSQDTHEDTDLLAQIHPIKRRQREAAQQ